MKVVADLHLHSKYSRAVSPQMIPPVMASWAVKKGIDLVGTADWTHPLWLKELESNLEECGEGIYKLKGSLCSRTKFDPVFESRSKKDQITPLTSGRDAINTKTLSNLSFSREPKFILSTEISSIYSQGGKVRRIHNLVIAPSFKTVYKINNELKKRGCNLLSDGRPIIGLSSMDLCELVWSCDESCIIIPCHVWTPWFSLYGSKSGFDSIDECFGKYASKIYAVETGLSSDPQMNWRIKELDTRSIVSFSDAHSPAKMGRELTVFELEELNYNNIYKALCSATNCDPVCDTRANKFEKSPSSLRRDALKTQTLSNLLPSQAIKKKIVDTNNSRILYTIEFHPEEGKYHYTGHRNCGIKQTPEETMKKGTTCPVCGKPLTVGVMHRVEQLASSEVKIKKAKSKNGVIGYYNSENKLRPPYIMLVPMMEIIAESYHTAPTSQKVINEYENLTKNLGSELKILTQTKLEEIEKISGARIAGGIQKVRIGDMVVDPGYDGVFGVVKIWPSYAKATDGKPSSIKEVEKTETKKEQMSLL